MIIIFCPATGGTADGEIYMYELDGCITTYAIYITFRRKRPRHYCVDAITAI